MNIATGRGPAKIDAERRIHPKKTPRSPAAARTACDFELATARLDERRLQDFSAGHVFRSPLSAEPRGEAYRESCMAVGPVARGPGPIDPDTPWRGTLGSSHRLRANRTAASRSQTRLPARYRSERTRFYDAIGQCTAEVGAGARNAERPRGFLLRSRPVPIRRTPPPPVHMIPLDERRVETCLTRMDMCKHEPRCPTADSADGEAARLRASHPQQGWSVLCNGLLNFEDTGGIRPNGTIIPPHRPAAVSGVSGRSLRARNSPSRPA